MIKVNRLNYRLREEIKKKGIILRINENNTNKMIYYLFFIYNLNKISLDKKSTELIIV